MDTPVEKQCNAVLAKPCPYTVPPFKFLNGHALCPCVLTAIRTAYIGGYNHGKQGVEAEVGTDYIY